MAHIYEASEWESGGKWYCNDTKDLAGISGKWWVPARMLGLSLEEYILLLKDEYKVSRMSYYIPTDCLIFSWDNYNDCHKFKLFINREARKRKYIV